jgi:hypothetical protein
MGGRSPWLSYYESLPDGRFSITSPALIALEMGHGHRIFHLDLRGLPSKVLLLDKPLRLGTKIPGSEISEFYLQRIRLRDVPGWPPDVVPREGRAETPPLIDFKLKSVRLTEGPAEGTIEMVLDYLGEAYRARLSGCPLNILKCVMSTLSQAGVTGQRLADLQDMRLIGA